MRGDFDFPTQVAFGPGRTRELPDFILGWGQQALVVTDQGVLSGGAADPVFEALRGTDLDFRVFDGVRANPSEEDVEAGLRRFGEECDFLIAVGGGSVIDAAKAIRLRAAHEGPLSRFDDAAGGEAQITAPMPRLVAIPTTAGTGSEVGRSTVITIRNRKVVIFSPRLIPDLALCDPLLTVDLPAPMTAGTGADALTHNLEAYFAGAFHPLCDAIALDGMRRAARFLPLAVREGGNLEAREEMMIAALEGAVAFQKGLGATHSLAHPLSTVAGVHHGTANAIMLPHVLRFNREAIAPRVAAPAHALGVPAAETLEETVDAVAEALAALFAGVGLPARLRQVSVTEGLIAPMAALAFQDACHRLNPRQVTRDDLEALYHAAL